MRNGAIKYLEELRRLARNNRNNPTVAEKIFWQILRKYPYTFLRQKPLGRFIADFYYSKLLLIIEIDGDSHDLRKYMDKERDEYFQIRGIKTIRITNEQVLTGEAERLMKDILKGREKEAEKGLSTFF